MRTPSPAVDDRSKDQGLTQWGEPQIDAISDSTMHYFSPAVIQRGPFQLAAGDKLTLRYRVVVHQGRWSAEELRGAADSFAGEKPARAAGRLF